MDFYKTIDMLYYDILKPMDSMCKIDNIKRCKYFLGLKEEESIGDYYYRNICPDKNGVVYTPQNIVGFMIKNTISEEIIENPFVKILDPSCGSGNILIGIYEYLMEAYLNNLDIINKLHNLSLDENNLNKHIIDNNIFGIDIDQCALKILQIELFFKAEYLKVENFFNKDFLTEDIKERFHIIIGNPPYIGTKSLEKEYSSILRDSYSKVFNDKGDISYCFFVKALACSYPTYKITFITSRYFMESLSGIKLRQFLLFESNINRIVDFYGVRPFKNAGIDPAIIFLSSNKSDIIMVNKPKITDKKSQRLCGENYNSINIKRNSLDENPWRLQLKEHLDIVEKIEKRCSRRLGDICSSYQGIITGLDKAFIISEDTAEENGIEKDLIKPWIKNSSISKRSVEKSNLSIIYSNLITSEEQYPNAIRFIGKYKERLLGRRECALGKRKWYELQWGRDTATFEMEKIIFPYKCSENRFVIDKDNYFSADIYSLCVKEGGRINLQVLQRLLNSTLYEFYFKCFAKKLGGNLYEYYPNNLNRLYIPTDENFNFQSEDDLFDYFNLSESERDYIEVLKG